MAQIFDRCRTIAWKRDGKARKIERVAAKIDNDLHLMWRGSLRRILKWMCGGDDLDLAICAQLPSEPVDQTRIDQRLVALNIHDEGEFFRFADDLSNPIGATSVIGRGQS